jgi:hypothetical protein
MKSGASSPWRESTIFAAAHNSRSEITGAGWFGCRRHQNERAFCGVVLEHPECIIAAIFGIARKRGLCLQACPEHGGYVQLQRTAIASRVEHERLGVQDHRAIRCEVNASAHQRLL